MRERIEVRPGRLPVILSAIGFIAFKCLGTGELYLAAAQKQAMTNTIVSIPPMEDFYIGGVSVKLVLPIFKMNFPEIVDLARGAHAPSRVGFDALVETRFARRGLGQRGR
jgi:hypothetical protein